MMFRIAALLCFLAVARAFGAHWLKPTPELTGLVDVWNKAVLYHFHSRDPRCLVLALYGTANRGAWWCFLSGFCCFSGSLVCDGANECSLVRRDHAAGRVMFPRGLGVAVISPRV